MPKSHRSFFSSLKSADVFASNYSIPFDQKGVRSRQTMLGSLCSVVLAVLMIVLAVEIVKMPDSNKPSKFNEVKRIEESRYSSKPS